MDFYFLEEDEQYQTQCGEMFSTTKGRLIFHCTLCERKFLGFDSFEIHIKEHIPIFNEIDETDKTEAPQCAVEIFQNECEERIGTDASEFCETTFVKKEHFTLEEALQEEEMPLAEIKKQNRPYLKAAKRIITKHVKQNPINRKVNQIQKQQSAASGSANNKQKDAMHDGIQIPAVVREVQSRVFPRSLLTPPEERKHKCPVCEVGFKDRHNMIHHLKRHSANKDHKCPECDKAFYTASEVRNHMRSHRNDRPFLCTMCGLSYVTKYDLSEHMKRHKNERNHKCDVCQKTFFDKTQLMGHMVGHSSERPFSCEVCAANFTRRRALKNHLKLHENKREFKCELCEAGFNQRAGLFSHMKTAHKKE